MNYNSKKRKEILDTFQHGHLMTAAEVSRKLPHIDPATVYRNINKFVEDGTLRELKIEKGISSYEINEDEHQHLICRECKSITPIELSNEILEKLAKSSNFEVENIEINIKGKCKKCTHTK